MKCRNIPFFICILCLPSAVIAADASKYFKLEDLRRIVRVSDPQISPDGKRIAVVVARPNWDEDKSDQEIDLVDTSSGALRALTYKRRGLGSPRWSPQGEQLAFLASDPDSNATQLYVMSMAGGDALRLTDGKQDVMSFEWSPNGKCIAFFRQDDVEEDALKHHNDVLQVTDNNYLTRAAVNPAHLWVVGADGGKAERLTSGAWSVETDQDTGASPAWSPDGSRIAYVKFPDPYYANGFLSTIESVKADGGTPETLVSGSGSFGPVFAPKGRGLTYLRPRGGDQNNGNAVYLQLNGSSRDLTHDLAHNVDGYDWLPDGSGLLLLGEDRTQSVLWRQPLKGAATKLDLGAVSVRDFTVANCCTVAFVGSSSHSPSELYVLDSLSSKPRQLTHLNSFTEDLRLGKSVAVDWDGPDGFREDGVLTYPADYEKDKTYPLVLIIHGGPQQASTLGFSPLVQLLAAKGFLVFQPNYRGSSNLGDAYQHAIYRDLGDGPGRDVMAGIAAVEQLGMVDKTRIGISGWSYGGYLTSWLNGRYPGWGAAVEGAAVTDWLMDYTISFFQQDDVYLFGGSPYGQDESTARLWRDQSSISLADKVVTPTLILGDAGDRNVPIVNGYEMYHALQNRGVPVEFYVYPTDGHFPGDIVHTTDVYDRWVRWMEKYLK